MCLRDNIKNGIIEASKKHFGAADLYLFGSRVDGSKKGGDIDLFVESNANIDSFVFRFIKLQDHLGKNFFPVLLAKIDVSQDNMPLILATELPVNTQKTKPNIIQTIEGAMVYFKEIKQVVNHLETYITTHKL